MSVPEFPASLTKFNTLKNATYTFQTYCKPNDTDVDLSSWRRGSLLAADIMLMLDKKTNRKRKNAVGHYPSKQRKASPLPYSTFVLALKNEEKLALKEFEQW
jgi:hypothetical protein